MKIKSEADALALQEDLDRLQEWERKTLMSFIPSKCEVIHITKKRNPIIYAYNVQHQLFNQSKVERTLVSTSQIISHGTYTQNLPSRSPTAPLFLRRNITSWPQDIKAKTYKTLVRPILEYAGTLRDHTLPPTPNS
jgi:hypothetical protein